MIKLVFAENIKKMFYFYFLNQDHLFAIMPPTAKLCNPKDNTYLEGTVSQNFD